MKVFYTDRYSISLPANHTFPMPKYRKLGERLKRSDIEDIVSIHHQTVVAALSYCDVWHSGLADKGAPREWG